VFFNVAGSPLAPMKCFFRNKKSGASTGFPLRRDVEDASVGPIEPPLPQAGGDAFLRRRPRGCATRRFPNWMAFHQMETAETKRKIPAAISATPIVMRLNPFEGLSPCLITTGRILNHKWTRNKHEENQEPTDYTRMARIRRTQA